MEETKKGGKIDATLLSNVIRQALPHSRKWTVPLNKSQHTTFFLSEKSVHISKLYAMQNKQNALKAARCRDGVHSALNSCVRDEWLDYRTRTPEIGVSAGVGAFVCAFVCVCERVLQRLQDDSPHRRQIRKTDFPETLTQTQTLK